ncbi:hypothetical protein J4558_16010 [Leptolyngbya sp. 15MV]|nr:hypothetical protein J4558_16010 [Leptolyngbya sp. 15MV]
MTRRLLIAFLLIVGVSLLCWLVLPRVGYDVPWWLPVLGYAIIFAGAMGPSIEAALTRQRESPASDEDDDDPGPSRADLERFGDPPQGPRLRRDDRP